MKRTAQNRVQWKTAVEALRLGQSEEDQAPVKGEKHFKPCSQDSHKTLRVMLRHRGSFQNFPRAPRPCYTGSLPRSCARTL